MMLLDNVTKVFDNILRNDKLSHLYLISSNDSDLSYDYAISFIKKIYSKTGQDINKIAHLIDQNQFPNLLIISPLNGLVKLESVNLLKEEFSKTSLYAGPRIFIIRDVEDMGNRSSSSLLKFLEEPVSKNSVGILLTANIERVLPTILSRCSLIHLPNIPRIELINTLVENGASQEDATLSSLFCKSPSSSMDLIANPDFIKLKRILEINTQNYNSKLALMKFYTLEVFPMLQFFDNKMKSRVIQILIEMFMETIKISAYNDKEFLYNSSLLKELIKTFDTSSIMEIIGQLDKINQLIGFQVNLSLLLTNFLLKYYR